MQKSRFSEEQIAFTLRQAEAGTPVEQVRRKLGASQATFFLMDGNRSRGVMAYATSRGQL